MRAGFFSSTLRDFNKLFQVTKSMISKSKVMKKRLEIFVGTFLVVVLAITLINTSPAHSQCNLKFEVKVDQVSSSANGGSEIQLKLERGRGSIDLYLIDLNNPQKGPVQKAQRSASELRNELTVVFRDVPPSKYVIQAVDQDKCQVSIGGIEGITISSN